MDVLIAIQSSNKITMGLDAGPEEFCFIVAG